MTQDPSSPRAAAPDGPAPDLARLADLLRAHAPSDGSFDLRVPGVHVTRTSRVHRELAHGVLRPSLCVVAQGVKRVLLGGDLFEYDASRMLVYSVDVPIAAQVTAASAAAPFLGLRVDLDPARIAALAPKVFPHGLPKGLAGRAICVDRADAGVMNAMVQLMDLMGRPGEAELLAPLVLDEIILRLLRSPLGPRVALIGQAESRIQRVAQAVAWVQGHFDQPLDVERLATLAHMSPSSFHQHFKAITSMSPLQYQKALRLQEARRLMLMTMLDAGTAGRRVGYLSPSQFSREYGRYFGSAPTRDMARLRQQAGPAPGAGVE
ncbi:AraC family transcriptional regulator [Geothrix rubra]|uniref:AraC family transcriptional regulator n=2 Tax=Geothrix rubra TaxID=2927977 RepID=A0ABQ5QA62_9BACT|nr:AraC family transcriptional regulator [Geothrix rubra]